MFAGGVDAVAAAQGGHPGGGLIGFAAGDVVEIQGDDVASGDRSRFPAGSGQRA